MNETKEFSIMRDGLDYKFFSEGKWQRSQSGNIIPIKNPYNEELVGNVQACTKEEADQIIECARNNMECW